MTGVQVLLMFLFLDSKMAKQQLQKWELKFVTELEPLEGASPVTRYLLELLIDNTIYICVNLRLCSALPCALCYLHTLGAPQCLMHNASPASTVIHLLGGFACAQAAQVS